MKTFLDKHMLSRNPYRGHRGRFNDRIIFLVMVYILIFLMGQDNSFFVRVNDAQIQETARAADKDYTQRIAYGHIL